MWVVCLCSLNFIHKYSVLILSNEPLNLSPHFSYTNLWRNCPSHCNHIQITVDISLEGNTQHSFPRWLFKRNINIQWGPICIAAVWAIAMHYSYLFLNGTDQRHLPSWKKIKKWPLIFHVFRFRTHYRTSAMQPISSYFSLSNGQNTFPTLHPYPLRIRCCYCELVGMSFL